VGASSPHPCGTHRVDGIRVTQLPLSTEVSPLGPVCLGGPVVGPRGLYSLCLGVTGAPTVTP